MPKTNLVIIAISVHISSSVEMKHSLEQTLGSEWSGWSDVVIEWSDVVEDASWEVVDSPNQEQTSQPEHLGAIFCWHCEIWLSGPTQWDDHQINKKHRKKVRRAHVQKLEGGEATSKEQ